LVVPFSLIPGRSLRRLAGVKGGVCAIASATCRRRALMLVRRRRTIPGSYEGWGPEVTTGRSGVGSRDHSVCGRSAGVPVDNGVCSVGPGRNREPGLSDCDGGRWWIAAVTCGLFVVVGGCPWVSACTGMRRARFMIIEWVWGGLLQGDRGGGGCLVVSAVGWGSGSAVAVKMAHSRDERSWLPSLARVVCGVEVTGYPRPDGDPPLLCPPRPGGGGPSVGWWVTVCWWAAMGRVT
jgi:hypothetical protein